MAVRIGELLLKEKRITPEQLQQALAAQKANGGKLGYNLVKMGFVKDEEITALLSKTGRKLSKHSQGDRAMRIRTQKGFTLIELLIVVAIIGIIAAIAVPGLLRARMSSNEVSAIGSLRAINTAQQNYSQQCNGYSGTLPELKTAGNYLSPDLTSGATVTKSGFNVTIAGAGLLAVQATGCTVAGTNYYATAAPLSASTGSRAFSTTEAGTIFFAAGITPPTSAAITAGTATPIQ